MKIENTMGAILLDEASLRFTVKAEGESWSWEEGYRPYFLSGEEKIFFSDAASVHHETVKNGIGEGIRSCYSGFSIGGEKKELSFETYVWTEESTGDVFLSGFLSERTERSQNYSGRVPWHLRKRKKTGIPWSTNGRAF